MCSAEPPAPPSTPHPIVLFIRRTAELVEEFFIPFCKSESRCIFVFYVATTLHWNRRQKLWVWLFLNSLSTVRNYIECVYFSVWSLLLRFFLFMPAGLMERAPPCFYQNPCNYIKYSNFFCICHIWRNLELKTKPKYANFGAEIYWFLDLMFFFLNFPDIKSCS